MHIKNKDKKSSTLGIRLSVSDFAKFTQMAHKTGISLPRLVRMLLEDTHCLYAEQNEVLQVPLKVIQTIARKS